MTTTVTRTETQINIVTSGTQGPQGAQGNAGPAGGGTWGSITGTLSAQTDLQTALNAKQNSITTGTTSQYFRGDLSLATFPTTNSTFANDAGYITSTGNAATATKLANARTINGTSFDGSANIVLTKRTTALTDAATITSNTDTTDIGTVTISGNRTLGAPSGTPVNGQQIQYRVKQDGTGGWTLSYNAIFRFSADLPQPTINSTASKTTYLGFQYNAADTTWDLLAVNGGF